MVVLKLRVIYNMGVVGCLLEDDYIHRYDYQMQKEEVETIIAGKEPVMV